MFYVHTVNDDGSVPPRCFWQAAFGDSGMMRLQLHLLPQTMAVYRLPPDAPLPPWAVRETFVSITRTPHELSVVAEEQPQPGVTMEGGWRAWQVAGPLAFTLTGVVAALVTPLAAAGIPVFVLSTFDTDYLLVKAVDLARATEALSAAGHEVLG